MRVKEEGEQKTNRFLGAFILILVLLVIVMVAFCVIARTNGFRELVDNWLEKRLGMEVDIESVYIGLPYVLVINDVDSKTVYRDKEPALYIREIRMGLGFKTRWNIKINRCKLHISQNKDGSWSPTFFGRLGTLPEKNIAEISYLTEDFRKNMSMHVRSSSIEWWKGDNVTAFAKGMSFDVESIRLPGRKMYHYNLDVDSVMGFGSDKIY